VVSRSGYGDGGYHLYGATNVAGEFVALTVVFLNDPCDEELDPNEDDDEDEF
jgi:hypothetical protein